MRFGVYAIYKGEELKVIRLHSNRFKLISRKPLIELGFQKISYTGAYEKKVAREEIETVYLVNSYALYKGYKVGVDNEDGEKISIFTGYGRTGETLEMKKYDEDDYRAWVEKSEVEQIWEEREAIYDFQLPVWLKPVELIKTK